MSIRIVHSDDHDEEIAALDLACFTVTEAHPVELPPTAECWVALDGDEVVGYLVAHRTDIPNVYDGHAQHYVDRYGVARDHAGKGIGQRLLRAWLRWAQAWPGYAWTYTVAKNAQSINALCGVGFKAWRPEFLPGGDGVRPGSHYCIWRKEIA